MAETLVVACSNCGKQFRITPDKLGRTFKCSGCQNSFVAAVDGLESPLPLEPEPAVTPAPAYPGYGTPPPELKTSGVAIASLVCGILFCFPLCSLAALVLGIIGITQTKNNQAKGRGMAIAGTILGAVGTLLIGPALLISILLPSLNRAREVANRAKCASNMHKIGLAMLLYQNDCHANPPDLATLWKTEQLDGSVFVCPASNDTPASDPSQLMAGGHLSYVYCGADQVPNGPADATNVVLYENSTDHAGDGTNILFGDGHVEWFNAAAAKSVIQRSKNRMRAAF
jgi:prepilin-type processing-associated H-X9-DG protein